MDRILQTYMNSFLDENNIKETNCSVQFEHFVNYCIFSKYCSSVYQDNHLFFEDCHTGRGGDLGIDGIMILVNGNVVTNEVEFEDIIGTGTFKAKFIFVQAKTSDSFDSGEMLKMGNGVSIILSEKDKNTSNAKIGIYKKLINKIFDKCNKLEEMPECQLYYVTTGKWCEDANLLQVKSKIESDINKLNLIKSVDFIPVDLEKLRKSYREVTQSVSKTVNIFKIVALPEIAGVESAYIGVIDLKELYKMITDDDGLLLSGLFYDNVRDFQGYNQVNNEIKNTLQDANKSVHFPILNNGITIVTKKVVPCGDKYTISDFQIVNGCQTCNVIYDNYDLLKDNIFCAIKLICSDDADVINDIIRATNRQTEVKDEAFESLKTIHKNIQSYFDTFDKEKRLYYERRSREYANKDFIKKSRIVSLTTLIKGYLSMFMDEPHSTHRYYGELLKSYRHIIFAKDNKLILYYTVAWCLFKIEQTIFYDKKIRKYRYHFLMLIAYLATQKPQPFRANSNAAEKYCSVLLEKVNDDQCFKKLMSVSTSILVDSIKEQSKFEVNGNTLLRLKDFTKVLSKKALAYRQSFSSCTKL